MIGFNFYSSNNPEIFWYKNLNGNGVFEKHIITVNNNLDYYSTITFLDLDSDGDLDIIIGSEGEISWYEKKTQGSITTAGGRTRVRDFVLGIHAVRDDVA